MGYVVASVGCLILVFRLHILDDNPGIWLNVVFAIIAFGVIAPFGGVILQAVHDLLLAMWRGQLRVWHFTILLAIVVASFAAGYVNYLYGGVPMRWFLW